MKKAHKFLLSVFVAVFLLVGSATVNYFSESALNLLGGTMASAVTHSGTCGDNLTWTLDESTGELVISGTGEMTDYASYSAVPWYSYRTSISTVKVSIGVISFGNYAFYNCTRLTNVTIPDSVTRVGSYAFCNCSNITDVYYSGDIAGWCEIWFTASYGNPMYYADNLYINGMRVEGDVIIPNGVTRIGIAAFRNCDKLTSITIPDTVSSIGGQAFERCEDLINMTIPDSVTSIGYRAFADCDDLTSVKIGSGVTDIDEYTFYNCTGITSIIIPGSVTLIGNYAFYDCRSLTTITIPDSVTSIGDHAFDGCTGITSITIPDSVTSIGSYAFKNCTGLTSVTLGRSVESISGYAFDYCLNITDVYYTGTLTDWCAILFHEDSSNPMYYADNLYIGGKLLEGELIVPDSVTNIGQYTFYNCSGITSVKIGSGVTDIDEYTFYNCTGITSLTIPGSVTRIGDSAFFGCTGLEELYYTGDIASWCAIRFWGKSTANPNTYANKFYINGKLVSGELKIPFSVTAIGAANFCHCEDITSVVIPSSVKNIGIGAFAFCTGLTDVTITTNITNIGTIAFYGCTNIENVYVIGTEEEWNSIGYNDWGASSPQITFTGNHGDTAHEYEEFIITQPTCTASGEMYYICICGHSYTEKVYATGHSPELVLVEPTCTQEGYEKFVCSVCSVEMQNNVLPATGHSYVMEILTQPTCVAEGLAKHTCLSCGDSYEEVIPETGEHTLQTIRKEPTCKSYGTEYYVCTVCGNMIGDTVILPKSDHTYGEWIVEKIPTATETGSKTHTCTVCDKAENATLPAIEFEMAEGVVIENDTNIISGFNSGLSSLDEYITIGADIYEWSYVTITDKLGTGSKAILKDEDLVIGEYTILVYGDINGDSWYDGQDAVLVSCLANGMFTQNDVSEAVYMAADCNHDGVIDELDVALLNEAGTLLANVDQSKPAEILLETSAEYVEYISLIDQSPEIEVEGETEIDTDVDTDETPEADTENSTQQNTKVDIFEMIINLIKSIFEMLLALIPVTVK